MNFKPRAITKEFALTKICDSIASLDNTLHEMQAAVAKSNAGYDRLKNYTEAIDGVQIMYRALINIVMEFDNVARKNIELEKANQELLRRIEILNKIDA